MLSFECIKNEKSVYFLLTSAMDPFLCKNRAERFVFSTRSALFFLSVLMIYFRFLHLFFHHSLMNSILPQYRAGCFTEAFEIHS